MQNGNILLLRRYASKSCEDACNSKMTILAKLIVPKQECPFFIKEVNLLDIWNVPNFKFTQIRNDPSCRMPGMRYFHTLCVTWFQVFIFPNRSHVRYAPVT